MREACSKGPGPQPDVQVGHGATPQQKSGLCYAANTILGLLVLPAVIEGPGRRAGDR
ncbi:MAG: hypothetical protein ABIK89_21865 [Planctomycetota bacterium]